MNLDELIQQILEIAHKNDNRIGYFVIMDLLKESKKTSLSSEMIESIFEDLSDSGIIIDNHEEEEDYLETTDADTGMYIPADVHIMPRNITIDIIADRLKHDEIDLSPAFQRKGGLWSAIQQSRLIESIMLKIPIPTFYFNAVKEEKWIVIDGLQRLTALYDFMVTEKLKLQGLEYLTEFEGCRLNDLPRQYYRRIRETQIQIYTIEKGTPDEVVFNIFKRINTGGLNLEPQEIRHALYQGKATVLVKELAGTESFLRATGHSIRTDRMQDCEYVTRYLAFTELDYKIQYTENIDSFLIKALKRVNTYTDSMIESIKKDFQTVMNGCYEILGKYSFRKVNVEGRRGPVNKALFEMWTYCIYNCTECEIDFLVKHKDKVQKQFQKFLQRSDMINAIKAGDKYSLVNRIESLNKMIRGILDDN